MIHQAVIRLAAASAWVFLVGCVTGPVEDRLPFEVLSIQPADASMSAGDLFPDAAGTRTFLILGDGEDQRRVTHRAFGTSQFEADIAVAEGDHRTAFWRRAPNGDVVMPATIDHEQNALTRFDPPLILATARIAPGEPIECDVGMLVLSASNPAMQRESGTAHRELVYVNDQHIRVPLGDFRTAYVRARFTADLRFASAEDTVEYWVTPGIGVVAIRRLEKVRILGVLGNTTEETLVRIE